MGKKQNRRTAAEVVQIYGRRTGKGTTLYLHYSLNGRQRRENTGLRLTGDPTGDDVALRAARHTFATLLITKGASLFAVSKLLGHTNIETTQIYTELVGKKKDEAIGLLNDL